MAANETPQSEAPKPARDEARLDRVVEPEYASISARAILALVLAGIAIVAFLPMPAYLPLPWVWFKLPLLVIIPLAVIPFAVSAVRDVRRSEGTKVGLGLAQAALVLAVGVALGASVFHGIRQWHEYTLERSLVSAADPYLEAVIENDFDAMFGELARNNPVAAEDRSGFRRLWDYVQDYLRKTGGEYYGRELRPTTIIPAGPVEGPEGESAGQPYDEGRVVHRFMMAEGAMDVVFRFWHVASQWKLVGFDARGHLLEYPDPTDRPKRRFEP